MCDRWGYFLVVDWCYYWYCYYVSEWDDVSVLLDDSFSWCYWEYGGGDVYLLVYCLGDG